MKNLTVWKIYCKSLKNKKLNNAVLVYPSESVFALGGNPFSPSVLSSIELYKHTRLSSRKGFILLVKSFKEANELIHLNLKDYEKVVSTLPKNKPLTIVAKARHNVPKKICYHGKLAVRIVTDLYIKELLNIFPFPLISTSLNPPKKTSTKSSIRARVFSRRMNINAFFIKFCGFVSENTSCIYDLNDEKWLRR